MGDSTVPRAAQECEEEVSVLRAANQQLALSALESRRREATATAASRQQAAFLVTVAHELRNPLLPPFFALAGGVAAARFVSFSLSELGLAVAALAVLAALAFWKSTRRAALAAPGHLERNVSEHGP